MTDEFDGFGIEDAIVMLEWAGYRITEPALNRTDLRRRPDTYKKVAEMVADNAPITEIMRTTGVSWAAIKNHFPQAGWERGGGEDAAMLRSAGEILESAELRVQKEEET